jgi:serine/threonine-protein kinase
MELLVGNDLAKVLRTEGPLDPVVAADYIAQACDAISEAHGLGIIHRDLKPGNLFMVARRDGSPLIKVLDFGVAKAQTEHDHEITGVEAVVGSPMFMSPEQLRGAKNADARSDIWSLGVILHLLVLGKAPFEGDTIADLAIRAATEPLPPLTGVPPAFAAIVARCLAKQPDHRFQTASDLAAELSALVPQRSSAPMLPTRAATAQPALATPRAMAALDSRALEAPSATTLRSAASELATRPAPARTRKIWLAIGAVGAIAIGISGALALSSSPKDTPPAAAAPTAPLETPPAAAIDAGAMTVQALPPADATPPAIVEPETTQEDGVEILDETATTQTPAKHHTKPKQKRKTKAQLGASRI